MSFPLFLFMEISKISKTSIKKVGKQELASIHFRLHQLWGANFAGNDKPKVGDLVREDLVNAHLIVRDEMLDREMKHSDEPGDELNRLTDELKRAEFEEKVESKQRGFCLDRPHGELIADGRKTAIIKYQQIKSGGDWILVSGDTAYGTITLGEPEGITLRDFSSRYNEHLVTEQERLIWWPQARKLWLYPILAFDPFSSIKRVKSSANTIIENVEFDEAPEADGIQDTIVIPHFIAVTGSVGEAKPNPDDMDVLIRADRAEHADHYGFFIRAEDVELPVRKKLNPEKTGLPIHWNANPQGPHATFLNVADLVLRWKEPMERTVVEKESSNLTLTFIGTGAMNSRRRGAALFVEAEGQRIQIDGEKPEDIQKNLDAILITDEQAWNAKAAKEAGGETKEYRGDNLVITPQKVKHTTHDVYGYEIKSGSKKIAYIPEFIAWPTWAKDMDLAVVDGSAWERDIRFTGNVGGHRALKLSILAAKEHNVKRIIATHIGQPTEDAIREGEKIEGLEVAEDGQRFRLRETFSEAIRPGSKYKAMKPSMKGFTEFFETKEIWENWVSKKLGEGKKLLGSPKIDGFRASISKDGKLSVWFEDAQETKTPPGIEDVGGPSFVIEGEFTAKRGSKWLARTELAGMVAGKTKATPFFWLYDLLYYDGQNMSEKPFSERLELLRKLKLPKTNFTVLTQKSIRTRGQLNEVGKWAASQNLSEGLFIREADAPYTFGSTNTAAKVKTVAELKVEVIEKLSRENGVVYHVGLRKPGEFTNTIESDGKTLLDLGNTFVAKDQGVKKGDTLNVVAEELVIGKKDGKPILFWGKPTVRGPDKSRPAYIVSQAIDLARRKHILKKEITEAVKEEPTRAEKAEKQWAENWDKLVAKGQGKFILQGHFPALTEEEKDWDLQKLLKANKMYHSDLRMDAPGDWGAWGFTCFEGRSSNTGSKGSRLYQLPSDKPMRGTFKLEQPQEWLGVGKRAPYISRDVGRTGKEYAKFFALDWGTYKLTFAREHSFEVIYGGEKGIVKGRYQINYVPVSGGKRVWMISRPKEQGKIYTEEHDLEKVKKELKGKGQKWLFWRESENKPLKKIDVTKD